MYTGGYYPHNYHFLAFAATLAGQGDVAVRAARQTVKTLPPPIALMVPSLEGVPAYAYLALVSFGRWQDVITEPMPAAELKTANGLATYARGVAFAALGRWKDAAEALESISQLATQTRAERGAVAPAIVLDIGRHALAGEIALRQGKAGEAVTHFELAPETGWSLFGLAQSLRTLGRTPEADQVMEQFRRAWQNADVTLTASRF